MLQVMERLFSSSEVTAHPLAMGFGVEIKRTGRKHCASEQGASQGAWECFFGHFLRSSEQSDCRRWERRFVGAEKPPPEPLMFQLGCPVAAASQQGIIKSAGCSFIART